MFKTASATFGVCLLLSADARAEPVALSGQALSEMIGGAVVVLDTPLGTKLPITYGEDGRMSGRAGAISFYLGASTDTGRWWISGDMLCQQWQKWFNSETQCMRIKKEGARIDWASRDGKTGTGTVEMKVKVAGGESTAQASLRAAPSVSAPPAKEVAQRATPRMAATELPAPSRLGASDVSPEPAPPGPGAAQAAPRFSRLAENTAPKLQPAEQAAPPAPAPPAVIVFTPQTTPPPAVAADKPAVQPRAAKPALPRYMVVNVAAHDVLNVRQGPSPEHGVVGAIPPQGRGVEITGDCHSVWCPVRHANVAGWVNRTFLESEMAAAPPGPARGEVAARENPEAPRGCLKPAARELLARIEAHFGPMELVSTCRAGATIAGSGRPSKHRDGNAIDFKAGPRKHQVVAWLIVNHRTGGTMTYHGMEHIHVDIGPHFVALDSGRGGGQRMARQ